MAFLQRGGELKEVPDDQIGQFGAQGWTDKGPLAVEANAKNGGINPTASQPPPQYTNLLGPDGTMKSQYQLGAGPNVTGNLDTSALDKLNAIGTAAPGTSDWEKMMLSKQGLDQANARDSAVTGADSAKTAAISDMASHGGVSAGARERLARSGMENLNTAQQGVTRQGALDRIGIGTTAEQNRLGVLQSLPGMQLAKTGQQEALDLTNRDNTNATNRFNITNAIGENQRQDVGKFANWQEQMKSWASGQQANADANAGKGGTMGWICMAVRASTNPEKPFTEKQYELLKILKAFVKETEPEIYLWYFGENDDGKDSSGFAMVEKMKESGFDFANPQIKERLLGVIDYVQQGRLDIAFDIYWAMTNSMHQDFSTGKTLPEINADTDCRVPMKYEAHHAV